MGCGCVKARAEVGQPLNKVAPAVAVAHTCAPPEVKASLLPILQAVSSSSTNSETKLDEVFAVLSASKPDDVCSCIMEWLQTARSNSGSRLIELMQQVVAHALDAAVTIAEELLSSGDSGDTGDVADFPRLATIFEETLRLDVTQRNAVHAAVLVLSAASRSEGSERGPSRRATEAATQQVVPVLDRIVVLFRHSLVAQVNLAGTSLQQWRELESNVGLPPLEEHLCLLGCSAKAVLLSLLLVSDCTPPAAVVVNRETPLLDAEAQLRDMPAPCVLLPYFESAAGTKVVQGRRVEGGEGHGPRKEFFASSSADTLRCWGPPWASPPQCAPGGALRVACRGHRIILEDEASAESDPETVRAGQEVKRCLGRACVGDRITLELSDGTAAERVVTGALGDGDGQSLTVDVRLDDTLPETSMIGRCLLQRPVLPLFEFHRGTGLNWFSAYANELGGPRGKELRARYCCFGKLLALALVNHCNICFVLPVFFFQLLLRRDMRPTLADLKDFDEALHTSLENCLKMPTSQFKSLKEFEGLPVGLSREEYVTRQVRTLLLPDAMGDVQRGFWSLVDKEPMWDITARDLRHIICPRRSETEDIDFRRTFKVAMEDDMATCTVFADAFWTVVDQFTLAEKRLFLVFVTGVESPPEPGTERLLIHLPFSAFSKEEHRTMLSMLPQAHTCTNTLELPNYYEALTESGVLEDNSPEAISGELRRLLGEKLRTAITESAGYELDVLESGNLRHDEKDMAGSDALSEAAEILGADLVTPIEHVSLGKEAVDAAARRSTDASDAPVFHPGCQNRSVAPAVDFAHDEADGTWAFRCDSITRADALQVDDSPQCTSKQSGFGAPGKSHGGSIEPVPFVGAPFVGLGPVGPPPPPPGSAPAMGLPPLVGAPSSEGGARSGAGPQWGGLAPLSVGSSRERQAPEGALVLGTFPKGRSLAPLRGTGTEPLSPLHAGPITESAQVLGMDFKTGYDSAFDSTLTMGQAHITSEDGVFATPRLPVLAGRDRRVGQDDTLEGSPLGKGIRPSEDVVFDSATLLGKGYRASGDVVFEDVSMTGKQLRSAGGGRFEDVSLLGKGLRSNESDMFEEALTLKDLPALRVGPNLGGSFQARANFSSKEHVPLLDSLENDLDLDGLLDGGVLAPAGSLGSQGSLSTRSAGAKTRDLDSLIDELE